MLWLSFICPYFQQNDKNKTASYADVNELVQVIRSVAKSFMDLNLFPSKIIVVIIILNLSSFFLLFSYFFQFVAPAERSHHLSFLRFED